MDFNGKIAVVTGASSGIGRQVAIDLAARGAQVMLVARRETELKETQRMIGEKKAAVFSCDVSNKEDVQKTIGTILSQSGKVDLLINNAGFNIQGGFNDLSLEQINEIMSVNYMGSIFFIKYLLPNMLKNKQGHIVNVSSVSGLEGVPNSAIYSASKFALIGLSESLYFELKDKGIMVSVICPGRTKTNFFLHESYKDTQYAKGKKRMMPVEQVSKAVLEVIANNKFMMIVPLDAKYRILFRNLFPQTYQWLKERLLGSKLYKL